MITSKTSLIETLEESRITAGMDLPPIEFLFRICGKPCFARGELTSVTGKAKSGKTFFASMLMAACTAEHVTGIERTGPPLRCLWLDTEQSRQSTLEILRERIVPMTGRLPEELYDIFNLRSIDWEGRLPLVEAAIREFRPDLVVLDGIVDLIRDINDGPGNKQVIEHLMRTAQAFGCSVVCLIHQNKGAEDRNPRGCIGTELLNKSFEVWACEFLLPEQIFSVEQTHSRKYRMDAPMYFVVGEDGLPQSSEGPRTSASDESGRKDRAKRYPPMSPKYASWQGDELVVDLRSLFHDALKGGCRYYSDLQSVAMGLLECKDSGYWNHLFTEAKNQGIILNGHNAQGKSVWMLPGKAAPAPSEGDLYADGGAPY